MPPYNRKQRVLFFCEFASLAHLTRSLVLARALQDSKSFDVIFCTQQIPDFLASEATGLNIQLLENTVTPALFSEALWKGKLPYSSGVIEKYVAEELRIIEREKPDLIVGDFRLTLSFSSKMSRVPYCNLTNLTWSPFVSRSKVMPETYISNFFGRTLSSPFFKLVSRSFEANILRPFNNYAKETGFATFESLEHLYTSGDHAAYLDLEVLFETKNLPSHHHVIGPVLFSVATPKNFSIKEKVHPRIFINLGSTGSAAIAYKFISALANQPVEVFISTGGKDLLLRKAYQNITVEKYLPLDYFACHSDLVVLSGGSASLYPALAQAKSVLAIPSNLDQFLTVQAASKHGVIDSLNPEKLSRSKIQKKVFELLEAKFDQTKLARISGLIKDADAPKKFVNLVKAITKSTTPRTRVLITGGAGFIGQHLLANLPERNFEVTVFDNISEQVHGDGKDVRLPTSCKLIVGDVRDSVLFKRHLANQDIVIHLAAETGTAQSMYEVEKYTEVNINGTSNLVDFIMNAPPEINKVKKVILASSRAIYGEGQYSCATHGLINSVDRKNEDLEKRCYEPLCPICQKTLQLEATRETAAFQPKSYYGLTKQLQEQMLLMFTKVRGISGYALRFQNVYGPGQSLKNPYTGLLAVFSNLARENKPLEVFEDGKESRDFIYVGDVVSSILACINDKKTTNDSFNVGSGTQLAVKAVAEIVKKHLKSNSEIVITHKFRSGDIRHNYADIKKIKNALGFEPKWNFEDGIREFLFWALKQNVSDATQKFERSMQELENKGLLQ